MNRQIPKPFHPGEYLRDELDERGWTVAELAEVTGIGRDQWAAVAREESPLTPIMATALGFVFGESAAEWQGLQNCYDREIALRRNEP